MAFCGAHSRWHIDNEAYLWSIWRKYGEKEKYVYIYIGNIWGLYGRVRDPSLQITPTLGLEVYQ